MHISHIFYKATNFGIQCPPHFLLWVLTNSALSDVEITNSGGLLLFRMCACVCYIITHLVHILHVNCVFRVVFFTLWSSLFCRL